MEKIEELIEKYERIISINNKVMSSVDSKEALGENRTAFNVIDDLKQLKSSLPTQQDKVVVPEFVAEWYETNKGGLDRNIFFAIKHASNPEKPFNQFYDWLNSSDKPIETLIRMKDGYTVEKEQLYYIELPLEGKTVRYCDQFLNDPKSSFFSSAYTPKKLTEKQIKAIDKRYWAFAVPAEEEAE